MNDASGVRARTLPTGGAGTSTVGLERKGAPPVPSHPVPAPRPEAERRPIAARLNGRPVQVLLQPAGWPQAGVAPLTPDGKQEGAGRVGTCQRVMQALWSWMPGSSPPAVRDPGDRTAMALRLLDPASREPLSEERLRAFSKAVTGREKDYMGAVALALGGSQIREEHLQALLRFIFSREREGKGIHQVRAAEFGALVTMVGTHPKWVPGRLWGQCLVLEPVGLSQAQVRAAIAAVLRLWQPDALTQQALLREVVLAMRSVHPKADHARAHRVFVQEVVHRVLDPRHLTAGIAWVPGTTSVDATQDVAATASLGLATALLAGSPASDTAYLEQLRTDILEPVLRASPRWPAMRLRVIARALFSLPLERLDLQPTQPNQADVRFVLRRPLPTLSLYGPVLNRISALPLDLAGEWLGGLLAGTTHREVGEATSLTGLLALGRAWAMLTGGFLEQSVDAILDGFREETRLARFALVGRELGSFIVSSPDVFVRSTRMAHALGRLAMRTDKMPAPQVTALLAGLCMPIVQAYPDVEGLRSSLLQGLAGRGKKPVPPALVAAADEAQVIARDPVRVLADPRFAEGDAAAQMLLLAHAWPQPSGFDDVNRAVEALAALEGAGPPVRHALAQAARRRALELTPANFIHVHGAMLAQLREAATPSAGRMPVGKRESKREGQHTDPSEASSLDDISPGFAASDSLLPFYEEMRECSGLMFLFTGGDIDPNALRANVPAIRHLLVLLELAQADIRIRLPEPAWAETCKLLDGTLHKIREPLEAALKGLSIQKGDGE